MSLPAGFIAMLDAMGESMAGVAEALEGPAAPAAIRLNALKGGTAPEGGEAVEWCEGGYYLPERPRFTLDPALHQGLYYVQDASSMAHAAAVAEASRVVGFFIFNSFWSNIFKISRFYWCFFFWISIVNITIIY